MEGRYLSKEDIDTNVTKVRGTLLLSRVIDLTYVGNNYILEDIEMKDGVAIRYNLREPDECIITITDLDYLRNWDSYNEELSQKLERYQIETLKYNQISISWGPW